MRTSVAHSSLFIVFILAAALLSAQSAIDDLKSERNPGRRSEMAMNMAGEALDRAREFYRSGDSKHGEEQLALVDQLADECLISVQAAHKSKYTKKAELRVAALGRRVDTLAEDLGYEQRGKVREVRSHLEAIHDKLLAGVMGK